MSTVGKDLFGDLVSKELLPEKAPSGTFRSFEDSSSEYQSLSILQEVIGEEFTFQPTFKREHLDTETGKDTVNLPRITKVSCTVGVAEKEFAPVHDAQ